MIPSSANLGGDEFLHAGFGGVHSVQLHAELSGGGRPGQAFQSQKSKSVPRLSLNSMLHCKHAAFKQIQLLQAIELFFKFSDLIFSAAVAFGEFGTGEVFFFGVGFTEAPPGDCPKPCAEAATAGMFEALDFGDHHQQGVVREIFGIGNLEAFPAGPVPENAGSARGEFSPGLIVARLNATQHPQRGVELGSFQSRPLTSGAVQKRWANNRTLRKN